MSNFNIGKKEDSISNTMCVVNINSTVLDFWLRQKSYNSARTFRPSNLGGSQEHISLITNSFLIILLSYSNSSIKGRPLLKFLALFYIFFYDRPFLHVCNLV